MKRLFSRCGLVAGACAIIAVAWPPTANAVGRAVRFSIISQQFQPAILNVWIGKYLGYFSEEGLDVNFQTALGAVDVAQRMALGQLDVAINTFNTLLAAEAAGQSLRLRMYYLYNLVGTYAFAVPPESDVRAIEDLRGKRIGVISFAENGYLFARAILRKRGIDPDRDVRFIAVGQGPPMLSAIQQGQVDALATFTSAYDIFHTQGYDLRLLPNDPLMDQLGDVGLVAREGQLRDRGERRMLVGFARAVAKATIFGLESPETACRIHFEMYPQNLTVGKSYQQNLQDCVYVFSKRATQYDIHRHRVPRWGEMSRTNIETYAQVIGVTGVDVTRVFTNELIGEINEGIDEDTVRRQAREFCTLPGNRQLCTRR